MSYVMKLCNPLSTPEFSFRKKNTNSQAIEDQGFRVVFSEAESLESAKQGKYLVLWRPLYASSRAELQRRIHKLAPVTRTHPTATCITAEHLSPDL